nr:hypothetical protein L204_03165 [Cryptococcus depauperatus CBS 7855]
MEEKDIQDETEGSPPDQQLANDKADQFKPNDLMAQLDDSNEGRRRESVQDHSIGQAGVLDNDGDGPRSSYQAISKEHQIEDKSDQTGPLGADQHLTPQVKENSINDHLAEGVTENSTKSSKEGLDYSQTPPATTVTESSSPNVVIPKQDTLQLIEPSDKLEAPVDASVLLAKVDSDLVFDDFITVSRQHQQSPQNQQQLESEILADPPSASGSSAISTIPSLFEDDTNDWLGGLQDNKPHSTSPSITQGLTRPGNGQPVSQQPGMHSLSASTSVAGVQELFADDNNDWLRNSSDQSTKPLGHLEHENLEQIVATENTGAEAPQIEVPLGWYNDSGQFIWYTDDEREKVRQMMMGQAAYATVTEPQPQAPQQLQSPSYTKFSAAGGFSSGLVSPNLYTQAALSENAARRTPQPEVVSSFDNIIYQPQAPASAQYTPSTVDSASYDYSTSSYSSSASPYAPQQSPVKNYNSYGAPISSAPQNQTRAQSTQELTKFDKMPRKQVYDAYDPPLLKKQQSFIRPASVVSTSVSPAFGISPMQVHQTPESSLSSVPPKGPSRGPSRPASRGPSYAPPPSYTSPPTVPPVPPVPHIFPHTLSAGPPRGPSRGQSRLPSRGQSLASPPTSLDPPLRSTTATPPSGPSRRHPKSMNRLSDKELNHSASHTFDHANNSYEPGSYTHVKTEHLSSRGSQQHSRLLASSANDAIMDGTSPVAFNLTTSPGKPGASELIDSGYGQHHQLALASKHPVIDTDVQDATRGHSEDRLQQEYMPHMSKQNELVHTAYKPHQVHNMVSEDASSVREFREGKHLLSYEPAQVTQGKESQMIPYEQAASSSISCTTMPATDASSTRQQKPDYQFTQEPIPSYALPAVAQATPTYAPSTVHQQSPYILPVQSSVTPYKSAPTNMVYRPDASVNQSGSSFEFASTASTNMLPSPHNAPPRQNPYDPLPENITTLAPTRSLTAPASGVHTASSSYDYPQVMNESQRVASPTHSTSLGFSPSNNHASSIPSYRSTSVDTSYVPQQVLEQRPVSEDPLGRVTLAARNAPIAVFGFGGTLITAFPGVADFGDFAKSHSRIPSYGYASGRGQLWIRQISDIVSPTALKLDQSIFPGPLLNDPSIPKGSFGEKKKKEAVVEYLKTKADEIEKGLPYLKSSGNRARREEEGKLVLIKLLEGLILGEGKIAGKQALSPQAQEAVRLALSNPFPSTAITAPISLSSKAELSTSLNSVTASSTAIKTANPTQLQHLSTLLAQGYKHKAAQYAVDQQLWSHALVISSAMDSEFRREIIQKFTAAELDGNDEGTAGMKAAYILIGGMNTLSLDELISAANISENVSNDQWREVVAAVLYHAKPNETSCLNDLGDRLLKIGLINAARVCFLLSPISPFHDPTSAAYERRIMLLQDHQDEETIIFTEIAEYARSLITVPKGQEQLCVGLPQLLPYKLVRAWMLAELGEIELAQRYCIAIEAGTKPSFKAAQTQSLLPLACAASLEDLLERLTGSPSVDPANTTIGGRRAVKGGSNRFGSWIEGRLTKFIAGEEGDDSALKVTMPNGKAAGPFAHFSSISPDVTGSITRNPSTADINGYSATMGHLGAQSASRSASPASQSAYNLNSYPIHSQSQNSSGTCHGNSMPWAAEYESNNQNADPRQTTSIQAGDESDFVSLTSQLSLGSSSGTTPTSSNVPTEPHIQDTYNLDGDEDLGFGNSSLSKNKTPKPENELKGDTGVGGVKEGPKKALTRRESSEQHQSKSWLGRIWGKKEGGPVRANLGEESSMVYDPNQKRWVIKGAKGEVMPHVTSPPPSRAQTVSPSRSARPENTRAISATPPGSSSSNSFGTFPRSTNAPPPNMPAFTEGPGGGIRRMKSSLAMSQRPPSGPPSRTPTTETSLDELLSGSRPASKRPGSAAKKGARNRYVDVFQGEGS